MDDFGILSAGDPDRVVRAFILATVIVCAVWVAEKISKRDDK